MRQQFKKYNVSLLFTLTYVHGPRTERTKKFLMAIDPQQIENNL